MSPEPTPDARLTDTATDIRLRLAIEQITDDYAMWYLATGSGLDAATCQLWEARVRSRMRRDLPPDDRLRVVELLLAPIAWRRADDLAATAGDIKPGDLIDDDPADGPTS